MGSRRLVQRVQLLLQPGRSAATLWPSVSVCWSALRLPSATRGARIMTTLVNALEQRGGRYGLQTMCEGGGMANATIIERLG